jgi:hypothetical protein
MIGSFVNPISINGEEEVQGENGLFENINRESSHRD